MLNQIRIKILKAFNPIVWGLGNLYFRIMLIFATQGIIFSKKKYKEKSKKIACFVTLGSRALSNANRVSIRYLKSLDYHVVVVVNMEIDVDLERFISQIEEFEDSISIIIRNNNGYDFGAYKEFINFISSNEAEIDSIILSNDSTYFPITNISTFNNFIDSNFSKDLVSASVNYSDEPGKHHQSYFLILNNYKVNRKIIEKFFKNYKCLNSRVYAIHSGEIAFSKYLTSKRFSMSSYISIENSNNLYRRFKKIPQGLIDSNVTHGMSTELISDYEFIFLKKDLAKRGILNIKNINDIVSYISPAISSDILRDFEIGFDPKSKGVIKKLISFYGFR